MKKSFLLLLAGICFGLYSYAQNKISDWNIKQAESLGIPVKYVETGNADYDTKTWTVELIKYLRENYNLPVYDDGGNKDLDIPRFNRQIADWHKEHPEFDDILELCNYNDFWKYDISCYPAPPEPTEENASFYDTLFEKWMKNHPEAPATIVNSVGKASYNESQKAAFYQKYFKK
jgi:hypothetical protein